MRPIRRAAAIALLLAAATLAWAQPEAPRIALVIGNGAYQHAAPLPNPVNDAADIAKELEAAGFTVIRRDNASLREMHLALREFGDKLTRTSSGVFYFAGHGVQVRGRNYLLPVDADIAREDEVAFSAERSFDAKVRLTVGAEEEQDTLAGRLRTVKVVREVKWRQRGSDASGTNLWTYWYSPEVKRLVRGENTNTTSTGKVLLHERWELESFSVK